MIRESYSADRIRDGKPIRAPFRWMGVLCTCTALEYAGDAWTAEAYRLAEVDQFPRPMRQLREPSPGGRNGFYDGVSVIWEGQRMVLIGPAIVIKGSGENVG